MRYEREECIYGGVIPRGKWNVCYTRTQDEMKSDGRALDWRWSGVVGDCLCVEFGG
jgi:hypothetical protein